MPPTVRELWRYAMAKLKDFPLADLEARLLLQKAASWDEKDFFLKFNEPVAADLILRYKRLLGRRASGCPLALLIGEKEFWSLALKVKKGVLIPRPETELLVEQALKIPWPEDGVVVDIGTGCGAIALALAKERPKATIVATDISRKAISLARENGFRLKMKNVTFVSGSLFAPLINLGFEGRCHLILCNPPYVAESEWPSLSLSIRFFEPKEALVAGPTGLEFILKLIQEAPRFLRPEGHLCFEIGDGQLNDVLKILRDGDWEAISWEKDFSGIPRVVMARRSSLSKS